MQLLKQSTAATIVLGPFVDDTDGKTAKTGLTISQADVLLHKSDGTSIAQKNDATSATHRSSGYYTVPLDTTDTNTLGRLRVMVSESGALPVWADYMVVPAVVYDSLIGGSDYLQVDAVQVEGSDATNQIRDSVVDDATRIDASALNTLSGHDPGENIMGATDLGTGSGLTAIPWNAAWDAEVQSECADALNAYDPPTKAELDSGLGALNDLSAADVENAVLDADLADHEDAGSVGAGIAAAGSAGDPWATTLPGSYGAGTAGKIVGDNLNAPVGTVDAVVDAIKAQTDKLAFTGSDVKATLDGETVALAASQPSYAPAKAGDAMTLTGAYDAAKSAASQTSVNNLPNAAAIKTALEAAGSHLALILEDTGTSIPDSIEELAAMVEIIKIIKAHKSIENEAGTLITYRNEGDTADAGTQSWNEATKTRGEYTPAS